MADGDIVAILRNRHACVTDIDPRITNPIVGPTIFKEAADEIERLRGEVRDLKQRNVRLLSQIQESEVREI
jgi:HAMP domain-containing protein